jgi:transcriptional regulator NrdR family protein
MVSLERNLNTIQVAVEYIKHFLTQKESNGLQSVNIGKHVMARQSPYPFTQYSRFPVFDKYVSWKIVYDLYDPPSIYVDKNLTFISNEIQLTDPDDLK